jgi:hypothetical protein
MPTTDQSNDTNGCQIGQSDLAHSHHHSLVRKQVMDNISPAGNTGSQIPQAEKYLQAQASEPRKSDATAPGYLPRSYETWKQLDPAQIAVFRHFPAVQAIYLMQL